MASGSTADSGTLPTTFMQHRAGTVAHSMAEDDVVSEMRRSGLVEGDFCIECDGRVPQFAPASARQCGSGAPAELICMWCARLRVIVATSWTSSAKPADGEKLWLSLQSALQLLVVEGVMNIDGKTLLERVGTSSTTASAPSSCPAPASPMSSTSAAFAWPPMSANSFPPTKAPTGSLAPAGSEPSPLKSIGVKLLAAAQTVASTSPIKCMASSDQAFGPPPALAGGPSPPTSAAAGSSADTLSTSLPSDEADWHTTLKLTAESLKGDLSSGATYTSLRRQRQTINEMYADRLCYTDWFDTYHLQTVQALVRRFRPHAAQILGKAPRVDIEIGYRQLDARILATIDLQRSLNHWINCSSLR